MKDQILCATVLLVASVGSSYAQADTPTTAKAICAEAHANIVRARLTYADKPLQDKLVIRKIFSQPSRHNEYHVELRYENEWQKKYPEIWLQGYYTMADEKLLKTPLMAHSVGDTIALHGTVADIELLEQSEDSPLQRPTCRINVRIDWNRAGK